MTAAPVSDDFKSLQAAQQVRAAHSRPETCPAIALLMPGWRCCAPQKVLRCLEIAGETLDELSKIERADQQVIRASCEEFLQTIQVCLLACKDVAAAPPPLVVSNRTSEADIFLRLSLGRRT